MWLFCVAFFGCVPCSAGDGVRNQLELFADLAAPAMRYVRHTCDLRESLLVQDVRAGRRTATEAEAVIAELRVACDLKRDLAGTVRERHAQAQQLFAQGEDDKARAKLDEAREAYNRLMGGL